MAICEEKGVSEAQACRDAGLGPYYLRDLRRNPKRSITIDSVKGLARALGVSVAHIIGEDNYYHVGELVELEGGKSATVLTPEEYGDRPVIDLLVTATIEKQSPQLFITGLLGRQFILYPADEHGKTGDPLPYYPSDKWHSGQVDLKETSSNCDITGVVQLLTIPYNQAQ